MNELESFSILETLIGSAVAVLLTTEIETAREEAPNGFLALNR